jgi:hypothetical protein
MKGHIQDIVSKKFTMHIDYYSLKKIHSRTADIMQWKSDAMLSSLLISGTSGEARTYQKLLEDWQLNVIRFFLDMSLFFLSDPRTIFCLAYVLVIPSTVVVLYQQIPARRILLCAARPLPSSPRSIPGPGGSQGIARSTRGAVYQIHKIFKLFTVFRPFSAFSDVEVLNYWSGGSI